jgi:hypothetical protein
MTKVRNIALNVTETFIRSVTRKGQVERLAVTWADIPDDVIVRVLEAGAKVILTNAWNGGGKDASDDERLAAVDKKLDSWKRGEFNVVERGESFFTAWKEVYLADCIAAGMTSKAAEQNIRDKVAERLGKDTKATFDNYLNATALEYAEADESMSRDEARAALEAYYGGEAQKRAEAAAKAQAKITAPKLDLAMFRKPVA